MKMIYCEIKKKTLERCLASSSYAEKNMVFIKYPEIRVEVKKGYGQKITRKLKISIAQ